MRNQMGTLPLRYYALLLALALLWLILDAPLTAQEWRAVPAVAQRLLRQLPARMGVFFRQWFSVS